LQCVVREYSEMSYSPLPSFHPIPSSQARSPKCMKIDRNPRLAGNTVSTLEFEAPDAEMSRKVSVKCQAGRLITITPSLAQRRRFCIVCLRPLISLSKSQSKSSARTRTLLKTSGSTINVSKDLSPVFAISISYPIPSLS